MLLPLLVLALQAALPPSNDPGLYVVGPNDVLAVTVFNQPQLSGSFAVEADGTLAFPLIGRVTVGGLSVRAVEEEMKRKLAAGYLRDPQVSVMVGQFRSQQVFVMGEVRQPGALPLTGSMTLIEALARVGSTTERAAPEAFIIRPRGGTKQQAAASQIEGNPDTELIRVNLESLQTGTLSQNVGLRAGDTILVPRAKTVFVSGHVVKAGEYVVRSGMTVRQVLALAGGVTDRGSTKRIRVIRDVDGKETTLDVDLQAIVQPGDTIVVRERFW